MESIFTYSQFTTLLNSSENNDDLIRNYLKAYSGSDVRLLGAKSFMETNDDVTTLKQFLEFRPIVVKHTNLKMNSYKIAASVVLILGLSVIFYALLHKNDNDVVLSYYTKDAGLCVMMGNEDHSRFDEPMSYYAQKDYVKTKQLLQNLNSQTPHNDTISFYMGEVSVLQKEYKMAQISYSEVNSSSVYYIKAQFKLALMYYINNDKQKAKQLFTSLQKNSDTEIASAAAIILQTASF